MARSEGLSGALQSADQAARRAAYADARRCELAEDLRDQARLQFELDASISALERARRAQTLEQAIAKRRPQESFSAPSGSVVAERQARYEAAARDYAAVTSRIEQAEALLRARYGLAEADT